MNEPLKMGARYATTSGTLWKGGAYFPRGTTVTVVGMHVDQGFCVRFPVCGADGDPLETWEDWNEVDFLAPEGSLSTGRPLPQHVLAEARDVLSDAEDGSHIHLHEDEYLHEEE